MRELTHAERAAIGAELMAEIYRGKTLVRPVNEAMDGHRALAQGLLFRQCVAVVEGVEEYHDTATMKTFSLALASMVEQAERLGLGGSNWALVLDYVSQRVEDALTEEEAR